MPRLTYKPEGVEPQVFDIDYDRLMSPERIAIERMTHLPWSSVREQFAKESTEVIQAFLYVMLKRLKPDLLPDMVQFCDADIEVGVTDTEAVRTLAHYADHPDGLTPEISAQLVLFREQVGEVPADPKDSEMSPSTPDSD